MLKSDLKRPKMNFKGDTDFSLLGQNFPHFLVRIYSVFWKKNLKQKNSKKIIFEFFFTSYSFIKSRQSGSKTGQKYHRHVFTPYKLLWKRNNLI